MAWETKTDVQARVRGLKRTDVQTRPPWAAILASLFIDQLAFQIQKSSSLVSLWSLNSLWLYPSAFLYLIIADTAGKLEPSVKVVTEPINFMRRQHVSSSLVWKMEDDKDINETILLEANLLLLLLMKRWLIHKNGRKHRFWVQRIFEERERQGIYLYKHWYSHQLKTNALTSQCQQKMMHFGIVSIAGSLNFVSI